MSERKVLNRYFPPDFDPKKLDENKKLLKSKSKKKVGGIKKKKFLNIRMLYPFTIRCNGCNVYHYVGTKFNSKVERVSNESYLEIPIWRFYGRCTQCGNTIVFKTNPKSGDYILESGATRNYVKKEQVEAEKETGESDIVTKVMNTANEVRILDELEQLRTLNKRLMNREVTELNALKNLMNNDNKEHPKFENMQSTEFSNLHISNRISNENDLDNETQFIINHINKHYDSAHKCLTQSSGINANHNLNHLSTLNNSVIVKENSSLPSYFNCYDSEEE